MTPWQRIEALFSEALRRPPAERQTFIRTACGGDADLEREVASLLASHDSGGFAPWAAGAAERLLEHAARLAPGIRIGPYEIDSFLAAGGMGVVYSARDTRLGRPVAIKVLATDPRTAPQALQRFLREAQAASALNHPNICTIYDVGTEPPFIAMELLSGETLQQRLARGRLEVNHLVDLALQLADALVAAHAAGIVHRDIKPANVFLTAYGPKILDFGLAKLMPGVVAGDDSHPQTGPAAGRLTEEGLAIGTIAYMSPEQLRDEELDGRTDLFSLGLVLYEMATGRAAFRGSTPAVLSGAILHEQPALPSVVRPGIPASLEHIIVKALEKDRDVRYQGAAEIRADLKRLKRQSDLDRRERTEGVARRATPQRLADEAVQPLAWAPGGTAIGASGDALASAPSTVIAASSSDAQIAAALVKRHRGLAATLGVAVALVLGFATYSLVDRIRQPIAIVDWLQDAEVVQLTDSGNASQASISGDGRHVAYVQESGDETSLWVRQTTASGAVQVVASEPHVLVAMPTVTPDAAFVDFLRGGPFTPREVWRVPFLGGPPRKLIDDVLSAVGWSPDGRQLAFIRADAPFSSFSLVAADADGSHERIVATRHLPAFFAFVNLPRSPIVRPAWSPDGRSIAVTGASDIDGVFTLQVVFVDVATGSERAIPLPARGDNNGHAWLDGDSLVLNWAAAGAPGQLWRVIGSSGRLSRLTNDLTSYRGVGLTESHTSLVTARVDTTAGVWVGDGSGRELSEVGSPAPFASTSTPYVAWVGKYLLYGRGTTGESSISKIDPGRSAPQGVLPKGREGGGAPAGTSDGRFIVYVTGETGVRSGIWRVDADGRNPIQLVSGNAFNPLITPDDRMVIFLSIRSGTQIGGVWSVSIDGGTPAQLANIAVGQRTVVVSPDNRTLAFGVIDQRGRPGLLTCELPTCANLRKVPVPMPDNVGDARLRWVPDGKSVAYIPADRAASNLWVVPLDGSPARQFTHYSDDYLIADFAWSHDGTRLALARSKSTSDIVLFKGLRR